MSQPNPALVPPGVLGPTGPLGPVAPGGGSGPLRPLDGPAFGDVLRTRATGVEFSKHAVERLRKRGIEVDGPTLARLDAGLQRAAAKGSRESVVFVDGTAFVVSVRNRCVITAVDRASMREHVFTNIDSAVIG